MKATKIYFKGYEVANLFDASDIRTGIIPLEANFPTANMWFKNSNGVYQHYTEYAGDEHFSSYPTNYKYAREPVIGGKKFSDAFNGHTAALKGFRPTMNQIYGATTAGDFVFTKKSDGSVVGGPDIVTITNANLDAQIIFFELAGGGGAGGHGNHKAKNGGRGGGGGAVAYGYIDFTKNNSYTFKIGYGGDYSTSGLSYKGDSEVKIGNTVILTVESGEGAGIYNDNRWAGGGGTVITKNSNDGVYLISYANGGKGGTTYYDGDSGKAGSSDEKYGDYFPEWDAIKSAGWQELLQYSGRPGGALYKDYGGPGGGGGLAKGGEGGAYKQPGKRPTIDKSYNYIGGKSLCGGSGGGGETGLWGDQPGGDRNPGYLLLYY